MSDTVQLAQELFGTLDEYLISLADGLARAQQELGELARLVERHRLVTVTGAGGAGQTSVAGELARRVVGGYRDGVWLVELASLRDRGLLAEVVVAAWGSVASGS